MQRRETISLLIMGDFNIPKWSDFYRTFVNLSQTIDVFEQEESPTYHKEFWPEPQRLDYVFLRLQGYGEQMHVRQKGFLFDEKVQLPNRKSHYLSDHLGLMAALDFETWKNAPEASISPL